MTVGTSVRGTVLMIVTETMALKAFSQRSSRSRPEGFWVREDTSGRREDAGAVGKSDMLSGIVGDREA